MITLTRGRHPHTPLAALRTATVHTYTLPGHPAGGVLAVLTGTRTDRDVAAHAGQFAARTGQKLTAAVAFRSTGLSINALLHLARHRRIVRRADAVLAAHTEALTAAGHYRSALVLLPARTNPYHRLPARTLKRLAARTGAATVITSVPLHPPGRHFAPADERSDAPPRTADPPAPFTT
ncbi:hypothetical protein WJ438_32055 [Streptomyces sp. GD-15H]|uniref:hypothetical protein n=1 Tax=Streptomyces sp. GD-15H TaxID=3129112 RepID=UPI003251D541